MPQLVNNEGILSTESKCCVTCGRPGTIVYKENKDRLYGVEGRWSSLKCYSCDIMWIDPRPVPEELPKLYKSYFTHQAQNDAPRNRSTFRAKLRTAVMSQYGYTDSAYPGPGMLHKVIARLVPPLSDMVAHDLLYLSGPAGGTLLDIGCGNGDFLMRMKSLGWRVRGVEFDPVSAQIARDRLQEPVFENFDDAPIEPSSCDVITMSHVIEHLPDPMNMLQKCLRALRPGGRVVLLTPNLNGLTHKLFGQSWYALDPPRHLQLFSRKSLEACALGAGFSTFRTRTVASHARTRWQYSNHIRRYGAYPRSSAKTPSSRASMLGGWAFHALEGLSMPVFRNIGEDLVMIAVKAS